MVTLPLQLQQFITLSLLLVIGLLAGAVYLPWYGIAILVGFAWFWEHLFLYLKLSRLSFFSYSAASTTLGITLMMASTHIWIYGVVIVAALLQKHFLLLGKRHCFNPSNFALIMGLLFFYDSTHIVLGQLGDEVWLAWVLAILAIPVLYRAGRWIIPLVFTLSYLFLQYSIVVQHDPMMLFEAVYFRFYSVSFLLFVFFMLTDPMTTPAIPWEQMLFAFLTALGAVLLDYSVGFRAQHLFMSLFLLTPVFRLWDMWDYLGYRERLWTVLIVVLALSAIIYIEMQPPYYFEMDG